MRSFSTRALVLIVAAGVVGTACSAILGIDDRSLDEGRGGAASTASSTATGHGGMTATATSTSTSSSGGDTCGPGSADHTLATQVQGDCADLVCKNGMIVSQTNDGDLPHDDGNTCTTEACAAGTPVHNPVMKGMSCAAGMKVCNDTGKCVECNGNSDCKMGGFTCSMEKCVPMHCGDKAKNNGETDVDCGGPDCNKCQNTKGCTQNGDCVSGHCDPGMHVCVPCLNDGECSAPDVCIQGVCGPKIPQGSPCDQAGGAHCATGNCADNVCCDTACNGKCEACTNALKGNGVDGACGGAKQGSSDALCGNAQCSMPPSQFTPGTCNGFANMCSSPVDCMHAVCTLPNGCHNPCVNAADCEAGYMCSAGICVSGTTSSGMGGASSSSATASSSSGVGGAGPSSASSTTSGGVDGGACAGVKINGDACTISSQCMTCCCNQMALACANMGPCLP
jgi:hypothetical protein